MKKNYFLWICGKFRSAKNRSANYKSANCHICERSANPVNPQVCGFAICGTYLRSAHHLLLSYLPFVNTFSKHSHTTHYLRKLGNTQQTQKLFVIPNLVLHCTLAFLIIIVYDRESLNKFPRLMLLHQFQNPWQSKRKTIKGSLTQDFRLQVFFINQCPPGPWVCHWDCFDFFRKFAGDNREWMFVSGVNDTGDKREKFSGTIFFHFLWRAYLSVLYT